MNELFQNVDHIGRMEILQHLLLATFSSAKCPASLILKAHEYAKEIRDGEIGVISGFHSPAEREVLEVLLKGKCPIVVVLGRRLKGARIPATWKGEIEKGRMLVISPFKEYQKYVTKEMSIKRNDLAARIAGRVMVVYASEGGGLQSQVEKWKEENFLVEYMEKSYPRLPAGWEGVKSAAGEVDGVIESAGGWVVK